jgi:hypothetical protein
LGAAGRIGRLGGADGGTIAIAKQEGQEFYDK